MRAFAIPILFVAFVIWILYRAIIKKDLKKHLNDLYLGIFFFSVWAVIGYFLYN
jgi:hypothetical protein